MPAARTTAIALMTAFLFSASETVALDTQPVAEIATEVAQVRLPRLDVMIRGRCIGNTAEFRIVNKGPKWPKVGALRIVTGDGEKILAERKMRFRTDQTATMKFFKAADYTDGVTMLIAPSWEHAGYRFNEVLDCR